MKPKYTVEVVYLGERVNPIGKISQIFRDKKNKIYSFNTGIKRVYFGSAYLASKDGYISVRPEEPKKQTLFVTPEDEIDYGANKEIVRHERESRKKAMELKKPHNDIVKAVALLRPFCTRMDFITLDRFVGYLRNQLSKKRKK